MPSSSAFVGSAVCVPGRGAVVVGAAPALKGHHAKGTARKISRASSAFAGAENAGRNFFGNKVFTTARSAEQAAEAPVPAPIVCEAPGVAQQYSYGSSTSYSNGYSSNGFGSSSKFESDAQMFEYMSAANPKMAKVPMVSLPASLHEEGPTRIIPFDVSHSLAVDYPATSPCLLAHYIRINPSESISTDPEATSQIFYVIRGRGRTETREGTISWKEGDVFVLPTKTPATHISDGDSAMYYVHDGPLLNYLGAKPDAPRFRPTLYTREAMQDEMHRVRSAPGAAQRNRMGILLGNAATPQTKTITHTMWSLFNCITPGLVQKPHRHNSVALDLCVAAKPGVYTLISDRLDENGQLVKPSRVDWKAGEAFITPPGLWHAHYNESDEDAYVFPVQDAGLHTFLRTLDIQFSK
eukprot:tig00000912_g5428.t1